MGSSNQARRLGRAAFKFCFNFCLVDMASSLNVYFYIYTIYIYIYIYIYALYINHIYALHTYQTRKHMNQAVEIQHLKPLDLKRKFCCCAIIYKSKKD